MLRLAILLSAALATGARGEESGSGADLLADIEDPATRQVLVAVFAQIEEMEKEIKKLRLENEGISAQLSLAEAASAELSSRIDQLSTHQSRRPAEDLIDQMHRFGVANADRVGAALWEEGVGSLPQLVSLSAEEWNEVNSSLSNQKSWLRLEPSVPVPLQEQLHAFGLQKPAPMAVALQTLGIETIADLVKLPAAGRGISWELGQMEYQWTSGDTQTGKLEGARYPLPVGDRALVRRLSLAATGPDPFRFQSAASKGTDTRMPSRGVTVWQAFTAWIFGPLWSELLI
jgi:hypothetical protein